MKRLEQAGAGVTVGVHEAEGSASADGGDGETVLDVACINEFGGPDNNPPARSFIGAWSDENEDKNREALGKIGEALIKGTVPRLDVGLERFGLLAVADAQRRMVDGIAPPNADSTVARKGSSTPLIAGGQLKSSITHQVVKP